MLTFVGIEPRGLEACDYSSRVVDEAALAKATDDRPFAVEVLAVLEELGQSVTLAGRVRRVDDSGAIRTLSRDEAILAGLMVRAAKLHQGLIRCCSPPRMELFGFLLRGAVETAVDLRYLIEHGTRHVFDSFVRDSLRLDKQLYERINDAVGARGGTVLPMEYGILEGVERAFRIAGVNPESVNARARAGWTRAGAFGRFKALGMENLYAPFFAVQSTYVHDSWQALYEHHLSLQPDGTFLPDPDFEGLKPQLLLMAIDVLTGAGIDYLRTAVPESPDRDVLEDRIAFCGDKGHLILEAYRSFRGMPNSF